jgi:molybdenum-dependent DNA-binding transcriptional regulator ModE
MRPDLSSLALFMRIAETRSITKAAEGSHIALAAASRRVAQLEDQFGVQLLYRTAWGVELAPAGHALLFHARRLMAQVDEMSAELSDYSKALKDCSRAGHHSALAQFLPEDRRFRRPSGGGLLAEERTAIVEAVHAGHDGHRHRHGRHADRRPAVLRHQTVWWRSCASTGWAGARLPSSPTSTS